jgi:hypothetical protein
MSQLVIKMRLEGEIRNRDFEVWGSKGKFGNEISKIVV